jgi:hypothetical protein
MVTSFEKEYPNVIGAWLARMFFLELKMDIGIFHGGTLRCARRQLHYRF